MFELAGKTVFITCGGGGIGGGMAQAFAECGARIVLADIERGSAEQEAARLPAEVASKVIELDVCDMASWELARATVGPVDVLCNNAGISRLQALGGTVAGSFRTRDGDQCHRRLQRDQDLRAANGVARQRPYRQHFVDEWPQPLRQLRGYSASKFAVLGLSDSLRDELMPAGVGVSTLFPGLTRSRMSESDNAGSGADMMDPLWVGRAVVRAVQNNEPYIVTHPQYRESLATRHERILAAFGEPAQPGYRTGPIATIIADA